MSLRGACKARDAAISLPFILSEAKNPANEPKTKNILENPTKYTMIIGKWFAEI